MSYTIVIQNTLSELNNNLPKPIWLQRWADCALRGRVDDAELCLRIVDVNESATLNETYRNKAKPTNVLSFPSETPPGVELDKPYLGDLVLCAEVIEQEAEQQQKSLHAHWAHMVIHGILHLLGYNHIQANEALIMETLEKKLLEQLGYPNPYGDDE